MFQFQHRHLEQRKNNAPIDTKIKDLIANTCNEFLFKCIDYHLKYKMIMAIEISIERNEIRKELHSYRIDAIEEDILFTYCTIRNLQDIKTLTIKFNNVI